MKTSARLAIAALSLALAGCPGPTTPPPPDTGAPVDAPAVGTDAGPVETDAGVDSGAELDAGVATDAGGEADAPAPVDAPVGMDGGVTTSWTDCREAVVFGVEGEACSFTGSCVECSLVVSPRQVLCMAGRLRVAAAGPGACGGGTDAGVFTFPDAGPARDAGAGTDAGGICPPLVIPDPMGAVCMASTVDCIRGGGDPGACITADPACLTCAQTEIAACATRSGCADEAGTANCCFEANCPGGSCAATTCATQWDAYVDCAAATTCAVTSLCFPSAPACPPAAWPAPGVVGCTMATRTCIEGATTGAALQACIDADTTGVPPAMAGDVCNECINDDLISCATDSATPNACDDELGLVQCCLEAECPTGDTTCRGAAVGASGACRPDWDTFLTCVDATLTAGSCDITTACFP